MAGKKEIEVKLLYKNKDKIIERLRPGIKLLGKTEVFDKYYGAAKDGIKNKNHFIRIRKINGEIELTYKGKAENKRNIISRKELTVKISAVGPAEKILYSLGYQKISDHQSKREFWSFDGAEIVFSEFTKPAHLRFMEIEANSDNRIKEILKKISGCVSKVGEDIFSKFDRKGTT